MGQLEYKLNEDQIEAVHNLILDNLGTCDAPGFGALMNGLAKMKFRDTDLLFRISFEISEKLAQQILSFNPQSLSNIAWGFAKLNYVDKKLFKAICAQFLIQKTWFNQQNLSNLIWALAMAEMKNVDVLVELLKQCRMQIDSFKGQGISNILWALSKLQYYDEDFHAEVMDYIDRRGQELNSQDLSVIVLSLTTLRPPSLHENLEKIAPLINNRMRRDGIKKVDPLDISYILWAYTKSGLQGLPIVQSLAKAVIKNDIQFGSQSLAMVMWSAQSLHTQYPELFQNLMQVLISQLKTPGTLFNLNGKDLECAIWGLNQTGYYDDDLFEQLAHRTVDLLKQNQIQKENLGMVARAFFRVRYYDEILLEQLSVSTQKFADKMDSVELSEIAKYLVDMGFGDLTWLKELFRLVRSRSEQVDIECYCNFLWCLTVMGDVHGGEWYKLVQELKPYFQQQLPQQLQQQIVFSMLVSNYVYGDIIFRNVLSKEMWQTMHQSSKLQLPNPNSENDCQKDQYFNQFGIPSVQKQKQLQDEIEQVLNSGNFGEYKRDYQVTQDGMQAQFSLTLGDNKKVAIQGLSQNKYAINTTNVKRMESILYRQLLESQNFKVLEIPYYEWNDLKSMDVKVNYVKDNLKYLD
eukprot:TRINITY_DN4754_c2_g3_i2.p1 TRINITY_DN4754_c2_g3~~TRINITY_DN4754_c2_g3_i2.p1  ORF type:complete len:633 (-),score=63.63 TRINITY_DN4754_c2_g3_i2:204-2102(-)